jgi:signal transduction histidine kinase
VLGGLVAVSLLLPATNGLHGLVWTSIEPAATQGTTIVVVGKGPGHYAVTLTAYLLGFLGLGALARMLWSTPPARPALAALLTGFGLLVGVNFLPYVTDLLVEHPPTVTPLGAAFGAAGGVVAVRYDLFGVVTVARRSVFETLADPVAVLDPDGRLLDTNEAFRERFGPVTTGRPLAALRPDLVADLDLTAEGTTTVHVGDDPTTGHYSVTVSPITVGSQLRGRSLVFRDVTDLTTATRQLERQNEQLDEIAYSAAHNLRNPLGVISGYADVLETHLSAVDDPGFDERLVANSVEKVATNSDRMEEIITDLLRVTHASKAASDRAFVPLGRTVRRAVADTDGTDGLAVSVPRDLAVRANPEQFEMLLGSLVRATRDRAGAGATVTVTATDGGFAFEDSASPIDAEDADVFLSYGYTTKYPGTGLGLAVAQVLATSHGWTIAVDPDHDGLRVVVSGAATRETTPDTAAPDAGTPPVPPGPTDE